MALLQKHRVLSTFVTMWGDLGSKFTRQRIWCPRSVFIALMLLTRNRGQCYRRLLKTFAHDTGAFLGWTETPSLSSFAQARRSLSVNMCREVLAKLIERISQCVPDRFKHPSGRRFIAFDGTQMRFPRTDETERQFRRPKYTKRKRSHYPQALAVFAVDLLKRLPLDWVLLPKGKGEREGVMRMAGLMKPGDVAVFDRGYPARWFVNQLLKLGVDVIMRMTVAQMGAWKEVVDFVDSKANDAIVNIRLDDGRTVPMRLVRRNFRKGRTKDGKKPKPTVILTTLSKSEFSRDAIFHLYDGRWGIETMLREIKCAFDVERFHSQSLHGMEQEIAAVLLWIALGSSVQHIAEAGLPEGRRVYRTLCTHSASLIIEAWLSGADPMNILDKEVEAVKRYHYLPKKGRSYPRVRKAPYGRFRNEAAK